MPSRLGMACEDKGRDEGKLLVETWRILEDKGRPWESDSLSI
jgi:hypothetical protein